MDKSIAHRHRKDCCGCNACSEICPKHCIEMQEDRKGFFYPYVNSDSCIECGLCVKVCPFIRENNKYSDPITAYAAWNIERETYLNSSSGGVAFVFSKLILENNGVIYGCSSNGLDISHIRVDNVNDLYKLQGSKYVQSNVRGIFAQVKQDIKKAYPVLFIGTPCQVAGLKNYIKKVPENLFLIDIICHGVSSRKMLKEHIRNVLGKRHIERISFRNGTDYVLKIYSDEGLSYEAKYWKDLYYKAFIDGITYPSNCYHCPFACEKRISDITIGDFWGLKNINELDVNPNEGISLLLPCTDNGLKILEMAKNNLFLSERNVSEAVNGNPQLRFPTKNNRSIFFNALYHFLPFDIAVLFSILDQKAKSFLKIICNKLKNTFVKF